MRGLRVHPFAQRVEVAGELLIIKRAQFDPDGRRIPCLPSGEIEERGEPLPCRVCVVIRDVVVAGPHCQMCHRYRAHRHHLVFVVVPFVHPMFAGVQILPLPQHDPLLLAVTLDCALFRILLTLGSPLLSHDYAEFRIDLRFSFAHRAANGIRIHALVGQGVLLRVEFPVQRVGTCFALTMVAIRSPRSPVVVGTGACDPLREPITALFQGRAPCGFQCSTASRWG